jgi:hypothetical protein
MSSYELAQFKHWQTTVMLESKALITHARQYWAQFVSHEYTIKDHLSAHHYVGLTNKQALWQAYCEVLVAAGVTPFTVCPDDTDLKAMIFLSVRPAPTPPVADDEEWPPL